MPNSIDQRYEVFEKRVNGLHDVRKVSNQICKSFKLGGFVSSVLIRRGYEDYNIKLVTTKGNYFVKMFSSFRSLKECKRIVNILSHAERGGVSTPRMFRSEQGCLHTIRSGNSKIRLCVTDFISGTDFFTLGIAPSNSEVKILAGQAALINSLRLRPYPLRDSWAIMALTATYKERKKYLAVEDLELVTPVVEQFKKIKANELPHAFVHGDLYPQNVIKDKRGGLWIVDFSVSNYYPRIVELAVLASGLLFDRNKKSGSEARLKIALDEYQKRIPLTERELEVLPVFIMAQHAGELINTTYYKARFKNTTKENTYFLNQGRAGLKQMSE